MKTVYLVIDKVNEYDNIIFEHLSDAEEMVLTLQEEVLLDRFYYETSFGYFKTNAYDWWKDIEDMRGFYEEIHEPCAETLEGFALYYKGDRYEIKPVQML